MKCDSDFGLADCPGTLGDLDSECGFKAGSGGAHSARTMRLADLTGVLSNGVWERALLRHDSATSP
jgi:hypothetical protein